MACTKELQWNLFLLVIYVLSGVGAPIVLEFIKKQGAAEPISLVYCIPNSIAMACVLFVPQNESKFGFLRKFKWQVTLMTFLDVAGTTLTLFGQLLCGSGIYIIIYSSLTIWSALGSRVLLKKTFTWVQLVGIIVVTAGLAVSGADSFSEGAKIVWGVIVTLVGTIFHSCVYWVNEFFNQKYGVNM